VSAEKTSKLLLWFLFQQPRLISTIARFGACAPFTDRQLYLLFVGASCCGSAPDRLRTVKWSSSLLNASCMYQGLPAHAPEVLSWGQAGERLVGAVSTVGALRIRAAANDSASGKAPDVCPLRDASRSQPSEKLSSELGEPIFGSSDYLGRVQMRTESRVRSDGCRPPQPTQS